MSPSINGSFGLPKTMTTQQPPTILIVDTSSRSREDKQYGLAQRGYKVIAIENGDRALNVLATEPVHVLISDLDAAGVDGMHLMQIALRRNPVTGVILMTPPGREELAVTAMREGAYDVLEQPILVEKLEAEIEKILERQRIVQENLDLQRQLSVRYGLDSIIGKSASMQKTREHILQIADTQATVLIYGESGTGKELVAKALYQNSSRKDRPLVILSCNALSEGVIDSELFGHEKGAFSSAVQARQGRFELADQGTLFLDEVGELTPPIQLKLLRVLQDGEFMRVGGNQRLTTDVRLIAATNRNLEQAVADGQFREDLYYRLKVITLNVPPLRERKEDLPLLIEHFIRRFSEREDKSVDLIAPIALEILSSYHWPGNIRELENCVEGMIVMSSNHVLELDDVPEYIRHAHRDTVPGADVPAQSVLRASSQHLSSDLIRAMIQSLAMRHGITVRRVSDALLDRLIAIDWSGNHYSLRKCIEMMILMTETGVLEPVDIPPEFKRLEEPESSENGHRPVDIHVGMTMEEAERALIQATLASCDNNKTQAARKLDIGLRTLFRKIKEYGIQ